MSGEIELQARVSSGPQGKDSALRSAHRPLIAAYYVGIAGG
jgi:hypothetical protein